MFLNRRAVLSLAAAAGFAASGFGNPVLAEDLPYGLMSGKPYAGTKVTYLASVAAQYDAQVDRLKEFTDLTGIEVEFIFVPFGKMLERILSHKVAGDSEPDLINFMDNWGPGIRDMFLPLDTLMARDGISLDRYFPAHAQTGVFDGKVYGIPLRGHAQMLFYRKDLLEKHGLAVPKTWQELVEVAKVIKEKEGLGIASYYTSKGGQNVPVWMNLLWSNDGELIKDGKAVFNSPEAVEALQFYSDLENKYHVNSDGAVSFDQTEASLSMGTGHSAFYLGWWWHYGDRILGPNTVLTDDQVGFTTMPAFGDKEAVTFATAMPTGINVESKHKEAAWEFLKWLSNPDLEKAIALDKSTRNIIVVLHRDNLADPEINAANHGLQAVGAASLKNSRTFPQLDTWPEIMQLISNAISDVVANGADPKTALDAAAVEAQKLLDRG